MGNYFEFDWNGRPKGFAYPPGWHGYIVVPGAMVLMYDDDKQFGLGFTLSNLPPTVKAVSEEEVVKRIPMQDKIKLADDPFEGIWTIDGPNRIADKWAEVGIPPEQVPGEEGRYLASMASSENSALHDAKNKVSDYKTTFCPICHQVVGQVNTLADGTLQVAQSGKVKLQGVKCNNLVLTCKNGHKVRIKG
jgi:hypothetical protein